MLLEFLVLFVTWRALVFLRDGGLLSLLYLDGHEHFAPDAQSVHVDFRFANLLVDALLDGMWKHAYLERLCPLNVLDLLLKRDSLQLLFKVLHSYELHVWFIFFHFKLLLQLSDSAPICTLLCRFLRAQLLQFTFGISLTPTQLIDTFLEVVQLIY